MCLSERATVGLKKEQVQGEHIIYFIKLVPLHWKNWHPPKGNKFFKELAKARAQAGDKASGENGMSGSQTGKLGPGTDTTVRCLPCSSRRTRSAEFSSTFFLAAASSSFDHCM